MTTTVEAIKFKFSGGLHIGRGAEELDKTATVYGSDALKSALFAVGLQYYPQWALTPDVFFNGFRISSAFPWCGDEYFLPKPGDMRFKFEHNNDLAEAKMAKKITYISASQFRTWASHTAPIHVKDSQVGDGSFLFAGTGKKFLHAIVQQRVQIPLRYDGETRPYYFERLLFEENSGLYFLISFEDETLKPKVMHALHMLGDLGIGTDRTVGNGQFEIQSIAPFQMPAGKDGRQMAIGLYLPTEEEIANIDLTQSSWSLTKRGGYIAGASLTEHRSLRKNNIYFFGEGSTFTATKLLSGLYVNLQPAWGGSTMHPVWRCGRPLFLAL